STSTTPLRRLACTLLCGGSALAGLSLATARSFPSSLATRCLVGLARTGRLLCGTASLGRLANFARSLALAALARLARLTSAMALLGRSTALRFLRRPSAGRLSRAALGACACHRIQRVLPPATLRLCAPLVCGDHLASGSQLGFRSFLDVSPRGHPVFSSLFAVRESALAIDSSSRASSFQTIASLFYLTSRCGSRRS